MSNGTYQSPFDVRYMYHWLELRLHQEIPAIKAVYFLKDLITWGSNA